MTDRPQFDDAPGLVLLPRVYGWVARWQARTDLVKRGFTPKTVWLRKIKGEPTQFERDYISERCTALQNEMLIWGRGGLPKVALYDGTIKALSEVYQTDPDSPFHKLQYQSRKFYQTLMTRINREHGADKVASLRARTLLRWHEEWTDSGVTLAHSLIGMLRTLFGFGTTFLEDDECERMCGVMHHMRFKMGKPRTQFLTAAQVVAIRHKAHEQSLPSIALANAFQCDCILRQKDVIGEWLPLNEPGVSGTIHGNLKWVKGLRWEEIDQNMILRHTTSKRQKDVEINLALAPMVIEELRLRYGQSFTRASLPASGPIVVCETTRVPWQAHEFRRRWRIAAHAAGVPNGVRNMDTRAGAISEATDAGAELEHVRHAATHGDISMTQRYSRAGTEKTATVMRLRIEHRNKGERG